MLSKPCDPKGVHRHVGPSAVKSMQAVISSIKSISAGLFPVTQAAKGVDQNLFQSVNHCIEINPYDMRICTSLQAALDPLRETWSSN